MAVVDFRPCQIASNCPNKKMAKSAKSKSAENFICSQPDLGQDFFLVLRNKNKLTRYNF